MKSEYHLFDLPDELYIKLSPRYRLLLFKLAYQKAGSGKKLAKILSTKEYNVYLWKAGKNIFSIKIMKKLASFLDIEQNKIDRYVKSIRCGKGLIMNPKLPIVVSESLGIVLASILGDGGVNKRYEVHYTNTQEYLINSFLSSIKKAFGDVNIISDIKSNKIFGCLPIRRVWLSSVLGRILVKVFNVPRGGKTFIDYKIPNIIFGANENVISKFIRRLFDDEGFVESVKGGSRTIRIVFAIENNKLIHKKRGPRRLLDLKHLLDNFGIKCYEPRKKGTVIYKIKDMDVKIEYWEIGICSKKYLKVFAEKIGFELKYKMEALRKAINSYTMEMVPKTESTIFYLSNIAELIPKNGMVFTSDDLVCKIKKGRRNINLILQKLKDDNLIIKAADIPMTRGYRPAYTITNKGLELISKQMVKNNEN